MLVPMLRLLRYSYMMLMMFRNTTLAPTLRRMLNKGTGIVYFRDRKYWPLILPQNTGDWLQTYPTDL